MSTASRRVTLMLTTPGWRGSGVSFIKIASGLMASGHGVRCIAGDEDVASRLATAGLKVDLVPTGDTGRREVGAVRRLFGEPTEQPGRGRVVPFLVRSEVHSPGGAYNPAIALEAAQAEAFTLLHGWIPGVLSGVRSEIAMWRETPPQALPLWDDPSGLWFLSTEYRAVVALEDAHFAKLVEVQQPRSQTVIDVVVVICDFVGDVRDLRFQRRPLVN